MRRGLCLFLILLAVSASARASQPLASQSLRVAVEGAGERHLDPGALAALAGDELVTRPPWLDQASRFQGLSLAALAGELGITGGIVAVVASDGSSLGLPLREAVSWGGFLAWARDGTTLTKRDYGPFWLVFEEPIGVPNVRPTSPALWRVTELRIGPDPAWR